MSTLRDRREPYRAYLVEVKLGVAIGKLMEYCRKRLREKCETNRDTKRTTVGFDRLLSH